jgi:hypothetical protein
MPNAKLRTNLLKSKKSLACEICAAPITINIKANTILITFFDISNPPKFYRFLDIIQTFFIPFCRHQQYAFR